MGHIRVKQMVYLAIMAAVAMILHFVEGMFPIPLAVPGIKLGLANVVSLLALYLFGPFEAFSILILRVLMTSFLFSGFHSVIFSLTGGLLSVLAMTAIHGLREKGLSIISASVCGGIFHNIGQLAAASIILHTSAVFSYLPVLMLSGIVTGVAVGMLSSILVPRLDKIYHNIQ